MKKIVLSELYIYPVKSCKGMPQESIQVGLKGPEYDRRWMVVDSSGRFLSQRILPQMAWIHTSLDERHLFLSAPSMVPLIVERDPVGQPRKVIVWKDTCTAHDMGDKAAEWLSQFLGMEVRLVFLPEDSVRKINPKYATNPDDQVGFADGFPFLLISQASLSDLNQRMSKSLRMNRFRPNLVLSGCEPYEEDNWKKIRIGEIIFHFVKPCSRCIITNVDQERAQKSNETLEALASYRKADGGIMFGQNLVHEGIGNLKVGSEIEILEYVTL